MSIQPLLEALDVQEDAARAPADDLRTQIAGLQDRLRKAGTHLEHLAITRKTVTALADRLPVQTSTTDRPEHPDYPRILTVFNEATRPLRAREVTRRFSLARVPQWDRMREGSVALFAQVVDADHVRGARDAGG